MNNRSGYVLSAARRTNRPKTPDDRVRVHFSLSVVTRDPEDEGSGQKPLFVEVGDGILRTVLHSGVAGGFAILAEASVGTAALRRWPVWSDTVPGATSIVDALRLTSARFRKEGGPYPVDCWFIPRATRAKAEAALKAFKQAPGDHHLFGMVLASGVFWLSLSAFYIDLMADKENEPLLTQWIRSALPMSTLEVEWMGVPPWDKAR